MKKIQILSFLLMLTMLLTSVISCKKKTNVPDPSQTSESSEKSVETDKWGQEIVDNGISDDMDFGGEVVNVLVRSGEGYRYEWCMEELTTLIDTEIYNRNAAVEEYLGITWNFMVQNEGQNQEAINQRIMNVGRSGLGGIDIVNAYRNSAANASLIPFYMNVRNDQFTYLDLDKPYWNQFFNEAAASFGRQYFFIGDMNLSVYDRSIVTFFNKAKLHDYTGKTVDELYELVLSGEWTYQTFYEMVKDVYVDSGTTSGERDYNDFYGLASIVASEASDGLLYSWDIRLTEKNDDGTHSLVSGAAKEKMVDAFGKLNDLMFSEGAYLHDGSSNNINHFVNGYCLFNIDVVSHTRAHTAKLADMTDGYGVIPTPKYDSQQTQYYTGVQDSHNVMAVMYYGRADYDMISAVLEYTASLSYSTVRPYYIETVIKTRQLDELSSKCFQLILDGVTMDWADVYNLALGGVRGPLWRVPFQTGNGADGAITNAFDTKTSTINGLIADLDAWLVTQY